MCLGCGSSRDTPNSLFVGLNWARAVRMNHPGIDLLVGPFGFEEEWESLLKCIHLITSDFIFNS